MYTNQKLAVYSAGCAFPHLFLFYEKKITSSKDKFKRDKKKKKFSLVMFFSRKI